MVAAVDDAHHDVPLVGSVEVVRINHAHRVCQTHLMLEAQPAAGEEHQHPAGLHLAADAGGNGDSLAGGQGDIRRADEVIAGRTGSCPTGQGNGIDGEGIR